MNECKNECEFKILFTPCRGQWNRNDMRGVESFLYTVSNPAFEFLGEGDYLSDEWLFSVARQFDNFVGHYNCSCGIINDSNEHSVTIRHYDDDGSTFVGKVSFR